MTSSYGYQRPRSNEEELYLQNQALRAELQRREGEKEGGFIDTLGKTALAAGAIAGAALAGRRLLGGKTTSATVDLSGVGEKVADVRRAAAARIAPKEVVPASRPAPTTSAERLQQIEEVTRQARAERPQGVRQVDLGAVQAAERLLEDPALLKRVEAEEMALANVLPETRSEQSKQQAQVRRAQSALADQVLAEIRGEQAEAVAKTASTVQSAAQGDFAQQFIQQEGYVATDSLVDQYKARSLGRIDQFANAANPAEDQATGRVKMALQRNEDVNLAAIEMAEDAIDTQIAKAAQGDPTVASVTELDSAINRAASSLEDGLPIDQAEGLTRPITAQEQANLAKQEMIARRQEIEARGLRPGTVRFERALAEPFRTSEYTQMRGTGAVETALPAGPIRETVEAVSASEYLPEKSVLNIGPQAQVTSTAAGTSIRGASPSYQNVPAKEETRQLFGTPEPLVPGAPAEVGPDFPGSARVRGVMPELEAGERLSKQEIVYGALDRPAAPEAPGGSAGVGVYGIEPGYVPGAMSKATGEYSAAASRKPTYVPAWLQKKEAGTGFEALTTEQVASGAEKAKGGQIKQAFEAELGRRQTAKESLAVSEAMRRARIEGRDPQSVLRSLGFGV